MPMCSLYLITVSAVCRLPTAFQTLEKQLESSLRRGHLSPEEYKKAIDEKRSKFPDGIPQTGADALRFTLCSYNVKSNL